MLTKDQNSLQEGLAAVKDASNMLLASYKLMLSEIAELYRKNCLLLTKEILLEVTTIYLGYHIVTTFQGEEEIIGFAVAILKRQISLAKQLRPLFTNELSEKDVKLLQSTTREEGLVVPQSADICHLFFCLIAENREYLLSDKSHVLHDRSAITQYDTGIIMERYIENTSQTLHCLYESNLHEGYELLLGVLFRPILLSALILAEDNHTLDDFAQKVEEYFEGILCCEDVYIEETIH